MLGKFPVNQVVGCRCTLLAVNSTISLAGSEEEIHFSQQSPKMLKMVSESFILALLLFFRSFSQDFPCTIIQRSFSLFMQLRWDQGMLT